MPGIKPFYFGLRERLRFNPLVGSAIYLAQSVRHSRSGDFDACKNSPSGNGVALCCRIRDEARYLTEFIEYYVAAGVSHLFFYEKLSRDNFREVLSPYIESGLVTLLADWPNVPVSPSAETDCVLKGSGRFEWIGFIDADEFVVIEDGRSIGEFLADFREHPAVALHWYMFGSNGHRLRPEGPVISEYTRREALPNRHVKCFVRPECVAAYRNSHSWYYRGMRCAVNEAGRSVYGSFVVPAAAERAWINHYHHKSDQDYFEKAARKSVLDKVGMTFETRTQQRHNDGESKANAVVDDCALRYYLARCRALSIDCDLLMTGSKV